MPFKRVEAVPLAMGNGLKVMPVALHHSNPHTGYLHVHRVENNFMFVSIFVHNHTIRYLELTRVHSYRYPLPIPLPLAPPFQGVSSVSARSRAYRPVRFSFSRSLARYPPSQPQPQTQRLIFQRLRPRRGEGEGKDLTKDKRGARASSRLAAAEKMKKGVVLDSYRYDGNLELAYGNRGRSASGSARMTSTPRVWHGSNNRGGFLFNLYHPLCRVEV